MITTSQIANCTECQGLIYADRPTFAGSPDPLWRNTSGEASCPAGKWHLPMGPRSIRENERLDVQEKCTLVVVAEDCGDAIIGKAERDDVGAYLGCIFCGSEIDREDAGACSMCRTERAAAGLS